MAQRQSISSWARMLGRSLLHRLLFSFRALGTGVAHMGELYQKNLFVGTVLILALLFGLVMPSGVIPKDWRMLSVAAGIVAAVMVMDGAFMLWDNKAATPASDAVDRHREALLRFR